MLYLSNFLLIAALFLPLNLHAQDSNITSDLKEIELKISAAAERKHKYSENLELLDHKYQHTQQELNDLQKKIDNLKNNIKKTIRSEFILRNQSFLKMLFSNQNSQSLANILFYKKINAFQAQKISAYVDLLHQRKNLMQELGTNLTSLGKLKTATSEEISNLKLAYVERSKILQTKGNLALPQNLGEIKIKPNSKPKNYTDKTTTNPLERIQNQQIYFIQKNRAIIHAQEGEKVFAINHGQVVFCGWMRGYGIIIIIDHGENLMSLYGHNQTTFKKSGDIVHKGEVISLVGKSGGHEKPGLYFEVRKNGVSTNLNKWLKITGQHND